jgi:exodeoxyribonuclease VII small subunit
MAGNGMSDGDALHGMGFEDALKALEGVVARLESGELSLEDALQAFERGVALVRGLNERLQAAEERVQILSRAADGTPRLTPADEDDS